MARQKVISAADDAARLIPTARSSPSRRRRGSAVPTRCSAAIGARFERRGASAQHHDAAPDRRRRHVGREGHRPSRQARLPRARPRRLLSLGPVLGRAAGDLEDDQRRRDPRLQRALRHPVRHASRGRRQAARRADQGRHGHIRRSRPRGLRDERQGGGARRSSRGSISPATTGCSFPRSCPKSRSSAPPPPTSAAISPTSTKAAYLGPLDQALSVRNNGGIVIAQVKRLADGGLAAAARCRRAGHSRRCRSSSPPTRCRPRTRSTIPRSRARFSARCRRSRRRNSGSRKVIARRVAQELRDGDAVNIGFGISANVPRILIEEGLHGAVTWVIEQGAVGGVPLLDFQFGCASNAEAIVPSPHAVHLFSGRRLRHVAAVVPADRPARLGQCLQARRRARM